MGVPKFFSGSTLRISSVSTLRKPLSAYFCNRASRTARTFSPYLPKTLRFLTFSARSRRVNPLIAGEDQVLLLTHHGNGLNGLLDGHRFLDLRPDSPPLGDFTVDGIGASLHVDASGDVWLWNGRERKSIWQNTVGQGYRGDSVRAVCRHFIDQLRGPRQWESTGRDYLRTVACVEAGYRSIASGRAESTRTFSELPATGPT